jgi:heme/copper-type cytochrome/quinol oxidase subunit 2
MSLLLLTLLQGMPADMPNCSEYPAACANYNAQQSGTLWVILAAVIILAAAVGVGTALLIRQHRRGRRQPPPPPWPGQI